MTSRDWSPSRLGVPAAAVVHLVIGVALVGRLSLWGDEAFTAEAVRAPVGDLLAMLTRIDVNMSAYYLLMKAWTTIFGFSDTALRLPSLLMTTATVILAARLVRRWFGDMPALVAAIVLALSPFMLWIGLTARPFAMLALVSTIALGCFVRALGSTRMTPWALVAALDLLAFYTSLLAALVIVAQVLYLVLIDHRFRRGQLLAAAMIAAGSIPALRYLAPSNTLNWLATPTLSSILNVGYRVIGYRSGLVLAALVLAGLVIRPKPTGPALSLHPRGRLLLPLLVVVPLMVMALLLPKQSLFTPPYLVTVFVSAAMLAGAATSTMSRAWARATAAVLAVVLLIGVAAFVVPQPALDRQDWQSATQRLDSLVVAGDVVVFPNTFYRVAAEHYARNGGFTDVAVPALPADPWFSQPPDTYDRLKRTAAYRDQHQVDQALSGRNRVWLVGPDDDWMAFVTDSLMQSGWTVEHEESFPGVVVRLLVRGSPTTG